MLADIFREELDKLPSKYIVFQNSPYLQKIVRRELRPLLRKLLLLPYAEILGSVSKMLELKIKNNLKENNFDKENGGYDSELTADLTSDDTEGEELHQIENANTTYKFDYSRHVKPRF